jgi:hypothetical protein
MSFKARHLIGGNVTFGRSKEQKAKEPFKQSLHYLWYEFLKRSDRYKKTCENKGKGELSVLYKDFGDVFSVDFKKWWQTDNRGIELFAEELADDKIRRVKKAEDLNLKDEILTVSIPLELPQEFILETVHKMLKKAGHKGEKGVKTNKESTARYKIIGGVNKESLRRSLELYDMKQENPEMKYHELAKKCGFGVNWKLGQKLKHKDGELREEDSFEERQILTSIAYRQLNRVKQTIKSVEEGKFPNVSKKIL